MVRIVDLLDYYLYYPRTFCKTYVTVTFFEIDERIISEERKHYFLGKLYRLLPGMKTKNNLDLFL